MNVPGEAPVREPRQTTKRPPRFLVLLHNDDYTTMEFVVQVLQTIFQKPAAESVEIMMRVHQEGTGQAGVYTADVAETKIRAVDALAREFEFPLKCTMEPE